jgi:hypothetical protein
MLKKKTTGPDFHNPQVNMQLKTAIEAQSLEIAKLQAKINSTVGTGYVFRIQMRETEFVLWLTSMHVLWLLSSGLLGMGFGMACLP